MAWDRIGAYVHAADIYCPGCTHAQWATDDTQPHEDVEDVLTKAALRMGVDILDEYSYDSDNFPKIVFAHDMEDTEICGECHERIE